MVPRVTALYTQAMQTIKGHGIMMVAINKSKEEIFTKKLSIAAQMIILSSLCFAMIPIQVLVLAQKMTNFS